MAEQIEQTLYVCREANVFRLPPRVGAGGYRSGDWRIADKIFTGRVKVIAKGDDCEVRLEDPAKNGDLFACCPIPKGQKNIAVEQASDSSRNFVLRLVDQTSGRHAFVGLSFGERGEAFDFNVALSDHEKHTERAAAFQQAAAAGPSPAQPTAAAAAAQDTISEAQLLYKKQDLSLRDGQTIKINMGGNKAGNGGGGFLSKLGSGSTGSGSSGGGLLPLAPPPSAGFGLAPPPQPAAAAPMAGFGLAPPPSSNQWGAAQPATTGGTVDFLGGFGASPQQQQEQAPPRDGWATFE